MGASCIRYSMYTWVHHASGIVCTHGCIMHEVPLDTCIIRWCVMHQAAVHDATGITCTHASGIPWIHASGIPWTHASGIPWTHASSGGGASCPATYPWPRRHTAAAVEALFCHAATHGLAGIYTKSSLTVCCINDTVKCIYEWGLLHSIGETLYTCV